MTLRPFPLVGTAYADEARPWSAQRCVNYVLEPSENEGTRSAAKLVGVPGLAAFSRGMQEAPVRGIHNVEGLILAVAGDRLYRISPQAVAIPIGTVPGTGRVEMEHNQILNGYEVLVSNGQGGYVYNTRTGDYGPIDDPGFPGSGIVSPFFLDGYLGGVDRQGRYVAHSELRAATEWNTLDRFAAEARPDKIVLARAYDRRLVVLGDSSGQFFRNTGSLTGTFQNENGTEFSVGAASRYAAEVVDSNVVWLGSDGLVYTLNGASPVILSTGPIADAMAEHDLSTCFTMLWEDGKHKVVYFTFPQGRTYGLDLWTRTWHERASYGLGRWRVSALCRWGRRWLAGDYANGRLYTLDWDVQAEYDQPLVRKRTTGTIHADDNPVLVNRLRIIADTGKPTKDPGEFPAPPVGPTIEGDAPNSIIGAEYEYAYTVTPGDSPIASVEITDGALPAGLTMDNDGVISGVPTEGGEFSWTVRATDIVGLWDSVDDSMVVLSEQWWGSYPTFFTEMIVSNTDGETWEQVPVDATAEISVHFGPVQLGSKVLFVRDSEIPTDAYRADAQFVYDSLSVEQVTAASYIHHVRYIDGIAFLVRSRNGLPSLYSTDQSDTWQTCFAPTDGEANDISKIGDRWLTFNETFDAHFYYSDQEVPTDWIEGASAGGGHYVIASNGDVAVSFDNVNTCRRTTDGLAWSSITVPGHGVTGTSGGDALAIGDVFLFSRVEANPTTILRSEDAGLTWSVVEVAAVEGSVRRFEVSQTGRIAVSVPGGTNIYCSDDLGLNWTSVDTGKSNAKVSPIRITA